MIWRLILVLLTLLLIFNVVMYVFTRNPRYLKFAKQLVSFAALFLLVFGLLFVLERYVLSAWRILL